MSETRLILRMKGTENQTVEIPKYIVQAGIAQGQISHSQLIWSKDHNAWKQVRDMPGLMPGTQPAKVPRPRMEGEAAPVSKIASKTPAKRAPLKVKAPVQGTLRTNVPMKQQGGFHPTKWICLVLALLILTALGFNYSLVDQPINSGMDRTIYAEVPVYAHLGAYLQPGALVIHIGVCPALTRTNLTDFLQVLAHNTPRQPLGKNPFDSVSLTTGWTSHYCFPGYAWQQLGDMADEDDAHKQAFLLDQLTDGTGQRVVSPGGSLDADAEQAERNKAWAAFAAYFTQ
jgi:hypothetical protein